MQRTLTLTLIAAAFAAFVSQASADAPKLTVYTYSSFVAEWGPAGEFGAEAGARHAFGKSAQDLNARDIAHLRNDIDNLKATILAG